MPLTKNEMREDLHHNICEVTFTKTSGEERVMKCTLSPKIVPFNAPSTRTRVVHEEDVLAVYDVDAAGWRSFKPSKVTKFEVKK